MTGGPPGYRVAAPPGAGEVAFCLFCGRPSVPGGTCHACQIPVADPALDVAVGSVCPRCSGALTPTPLEAGTSVHACGGCNGVFVGARAWSLLVGRPDLVVRFESQRPRGDVTSSAIGLVRCPSCNREMERGRFAARSATQIDVCSAHGMWLDAGELGEAVGYTSRRLENGEEPAFDEAGANAGQGVLSPEAATYVAQLDAWRAQHLDRLEDSLVARASSSESRSSGYLDPEVSRSYTRRHGMAPRRRTSIFVIAAAICLIALANVVKCEQGSGARRPPPETPTTR
ncbi:MAG: zf-TFIIB domain-containing protein [Labilithrix sp.]|nr:zf-TFIIB domain-containing protein [Labilithrix sp.]